MAGLGCGGPLARDPAALGDAPDLAAELGAGFDADLDGIARLVAVRFFAACATRADRTTSLRAAMAAALRLVVLRLPPWHLTVLPLAAPAFLAVAALLPCVPPAPGAAGSARPSLMAPSTSRFFLSATSSDSTMMLWSPATDGMKVRNKIASFALFIGANTSARSGGVGDALFLVAALVLGEYHSVISVLPSAANVLWFGFMSAVRSFWPCLLLSGAEIGFGTGSLSSRNRCQ